MVLKKKKLTKIFLSLILWIQAASFKIWRWQLIYWNTYLKIYSVIKLASLFLHNFQIADLLNVSKYREIHLINSHFFINIFSLSFQTMRSKSEHRNPGRRKSHRPMATQLKFYAGLPQLFPRIIQYLPFRDTLNPFRSEFHLPILLSFAIYRTAAVYSTTMSGTATRRRSYRYVEDIAFIPRCWRILTGISGTHRIV